MKVLVTGASGFIGSTFIRLFLNEFQMVGLIHNSDQRNLARLWNHEQAVDAKRSGHLRIVFGDLLGDISGICEGVDAVVHFAAKTFVDHSIRDPWPFVEANVVGTYRLLEEARRNSVKRFIQVSTDEVYGAILSGAYTENAAINPTNPYSASKAGGDALALSYAHAFGMHVTVTRTENNYGIYQHPQKVFPTFVKTALRDDPLPVYGDGQHVRQWLWVEDHVRAIRMLLSADIPSGEVFHVAGNQELTNLHLARRILRALGKPEDRLRFIDDRNIRPGHDRRYALDCTKLRKAVGWKPEVGLDEGIQLAVDWYASNPWWLE